VHDEFSTFRGEVIKSIEALFNNHRELLQGFFASEANVRVLHRVIDDFVSAGAVPDGVMSTDDGGIAWAEYYTAVGEELAREEKERADIRESQDEAKKKVEEEVSQEENPYPEGAKIFGGDFNEDSDDKE
jgi:hypothetical protein